MRRWIGRVLAATLWVLTLGLVELDWTGEGDASARRAHGDGIEQVAAPEPTDRAR